MGEWINTLRAVDGDMELRAVEVLRSGNIIRDLSLHARTSGDRGRPLVLQGQGKYRGERLALTARIGAHQGPERKGLLPIDIEGGLGGARFNLAGTIAAGGEIGMLRFNIRGSHLARLSRFTGIKIAPDKAYRASGTLNRSERGWMFSDLDAALGDSDLAGDIKVSLAEGERPRVTGKLRSSKLALDELKQFWRSGSAGKGGDGEPHSSDRRSSDSALIRFDANIDWRAGEVALSALSVKNVDTNVQWDRGELVLKPLDVAFAGGRLNVHLNIDSHEPPPRLSGRLTMKRADLATLLKALHTEPEAQGRIGGDLDFSTRAGSLQAMLAALDGRLDLVMENGRIDSELLSKIALDLSKLIFSGAVKDETRIDCFVARFAIHDGHMHAEALLLSTPDTDVTGRGNIDLRTQAVNLILNPHPKGLGIGRSSGPVHIGGTLKHRTASSDTSDVAAATGAGAALGAVVNPLLALIPLIHMGNEDEDVCQRAIALVGRPGVGRPGVGKPGNSPKH